MNHIQLFEIANKTGTDKGHKGPSSSWSANNYVDVYQAYFGPNRLAISNFCEIGLGVRGPSWDSKIAHGDNAEGGGSARMWEEFFPNAKIVGLDINPADHLNTSRIQTHVVDQSSSDSLQSFKQSIGDTKFDIILDDGSHIADHQQLTLSLLWEALAPGGFYVIEDLNSQELGGVSHTKHAPKNVVSTRRLFQEYLESGSVNPKNAFVDEHFLSEISYLALHAFPTTQTLKDFARETLRTFIGRGGKGLLRHQFDTAAPKMVVMQKRDA